MAGWTAHVYMAITRAHSNRTHLVDGHEDLLTETKATMHLPRSRQEKAVLSATCDAGGGGGGRCNTF